MATTTRVTLREFLDQDGGKPYREYVCGEVIEKPMPKRSHAFLQIFLGGLLVQFLARAGLGRAGTEWRCVFGPPGRERALIPDIAYIAQARCVDGLVLDLVTTLLRQSPTPPVILIVGDHGSRFTDVHYYDHPDSVPDAFIRERFGAFGAFYLPAGGDSAFREPVTVVNVLGNVLRYYFGADLPRSPDDMYVSGVRPYRFYRVDPPRYSGQ